MSKRRTRHIKTCRNEFGYVYIVNSITKLCHIRGKGAEESEIRYLVDQVSKGEGIPMDNYSWEATRNGKLCRVTG